MRPLTDVDEYGVLVSGEDGVISFDDVLGRAAGHPKGVVRVEVPEFEKEEVAAVVGYWEGAGLVPMSE